MQKMLESNAKKDKIYKELEGLWKAIKGLRHQILEIGDNFERHLGMSIKEWED